MTRIFTDSAADFEPKEAEALGITIVPLTVLFGETEYQENVTLDKSRFYHLLASRTAFPKTSQPTPYQFESVLRTAKRRKEEAVVISLSARLSGTYQSAMIAKNNLAYDSCHIVDSMQVSAGERLLVEHAVRLRDAGASAKEIAKELLELRERIVIFACLDTLEFLQKGGRISKSVAVIGGMANIKPIVALNDGLVGMAGKAIGKKRTQLAMLAKCEKYTPDTAHSVCLLYSDTPEPMREFQTLLREQRADFPEPKICRIGAAIGTHIGPGACGIAFVTKKD